MSKDHKIIKKQARRARYIKRKKKQLKEKLKLIKVGKPRSSMPGTVSATDQSE